MPLHQVVDAPVEESLESVRERLELDDLGKGSDSLLLSELFAIR